MLLFPSDVELLPPTQIEQFSSFLGLHLMLPGSLLLPRSWFAAPVRIAFPFLPESLEQLRENEHD